MAEEDEPDDRIPYFVEIDEVSSTRLPINFVRLYAVTYDGSPENFDPTNFSYKGHGNLKGGNIISARKVAEIILESSMIGRHFGYSAFLNACAGRMNDVHFLGKHKKLI